MKIYSIIILAVFVYGCAPKQETKKLLLPIIGEKKIAGVDAKDTIYHTIQPFAFVNQYNDTVSEKTINNKIYVADFFFATCQSICPKMSNHLQQIQTQDWKQHLYFSMELHQ